MSNEEMKEKLGKHIEWYGKKLLKIDCKENYLTSIIQYSYNNSNFYLIKTGGQIVKIIEGKECY